MVFKGWAYIAASTCIVIGICVLKRNKWKINGGVVWIICLSLAVFVGGNLNIGKISPSIINSFNQIEKEVQGLKAKVQQVVALKQQVSQTVNLVTEVRKEIANIEEVIHQQYASFKVELFNEEDLNKKVKAFPNPVDPDNESVIFFELGNIPEKNSVIVASSLGVAPSTSYGVNANVISLKHSVAKDQVFKKGGTYYEIKYIPTLFSDEGLYKVKDMEFHPLEDGKYNANFHLKDGNN